MKLRCKKVLLEDYISSAIILIEEDRIVDILPYDETTDCDYNYTHETVIPGLIDVHLHGFEGLILPHKKVEIEDIHALQYKLATLGTTSFFVSLNPKNYSHLSDSLTSSNSGFMGFSLEAYFTSSNYSGASVTKRKECTILNLETMLNESKMLLKYVMIAPELEHAKEVMKYLHNKNVLVSAGHTMMTSDDFESFLDERLIDSLTHTGNNMGVMHQRNVGVMGKGLLDKNVYCELITDFTHVSKEMCEIILKVKGIKKLMFVSDSTVLSHMPIAKYEADGYSIEITNDFEVLEDNGSITGTYFSLLENTLNIIDSKIISFEDGIRAASIKPAEFLNIDKDIGSISIGKIANLVVLDNNIVSSVFMNGKKVII